MSSAANSSGPRSRRLRHVRPIPLAAGVYLGAALLLTLSAWRDPTNSTIGVYGDPDKFMGFIAWFPFALTHGHNPLHMTWIDLPTGINAMWDGSVSLAAYVVWPVRAVFGVAAAYNVAVVGALTLDGLCTFLWVRRHTRHQAAALASSLLMVGGPYAVARTFGHLNLLLFFAIPLMLILVEDIVREPRRHRLPRGLALGALAAVQLLCSEELLADAAIVLVVGLVLAAVLAPSAAMRRAGALVPTAIGAILGFAVLGGYPLAYQFLGPSVIHGAIPAPDVFVNDLLNFVVPTSATAIAPGAPGIDGVPPAAWTGNPIEWNAYVGVPLLLVSVFTVIRWRRERWLLLVGLTTAAAAVISLGPHLHVNGVDYTGFPLPEAIIDKLPVFSNIEANRFSLFIDMGLAAVLAFFIDRLIGEKERRRRYLGEVAVVLVTASLVPLGVPAVPTSVPRFFQAGGDVATIEPGTAALVFPIPYVGGSQSTESAVWQGVADFRFKMVSGASISATASGAPSLGSTAEPLRCITDNLQLNGTDLPCNTPPSVFLAQLHDLGVRAVIVGPVTNEAAIRSYFVGLTGEQPIADQGVLLWRI